VSLGVPVEDYGTLQTEVKFEFMFIEFYVGLKI